MAKFENTFSWSRSRDGTFKECRRKYWFTYYGSWGGWETYAPQESREAYLLKKTQTRWMWAGSVVHKSLENVLKRTRSGDEPALDTVVTEAVSGMRAQFLESRRGDIRRNTRAQALAEHEYLENIPGDEWVAVRDLVVQCIENYWKSDIRREVNSLEPHAWLSIEDLCSHDFEGTKVWVVPDLAYRRHDGTTVLVDWKTTRAESAPDPIQLVIYALYSIIYWGASPANIHALEVRLCTGATHSVPVDDPQVIQVQQYMRDSIAEMQAVLADNARNLAEKSAFPMTDDRTKCHECVFRALCHGFPWRGIGQRNGSYPS